MNFGMHVSISPSISQSPLNAKKMGCECFQCFSQSPRGGTRKLPEQKVIDEFKRNLKLSGIDNFYLHAPYFINLASKNNRIYHGSINAIKNDLKIVKMLNGKGLIIHIGSAKDFFTKNELKKEKEKKICQMPKEAMDRVLEAFKKIFENRKEKKDLGALILENSAGAGKIIGSNLQELKFFLDNCADIDGICYDTAHAFASGIASDLKGTVNQIEKEIGIDNIRVFHVNDSKTGFASYKDRHEHLGAGEIGEQFFKDLIEEKKLNGLDFILETPHDEKIKEDLSFLKKIRDNTSS